MRAPSLRRQVVVVDRQGGVATGLAFTQIKALPLDVAPVGRGLDLRGGPVARGASPDRDRKLHVEEDREVPTVPELRPMQEDAVKHKDGAWTSLLPGPGHRKVGGEIVNRRAEWPALAQR